MMGRLKEIMKYAKNLLPPWIPPGKRKEYEKYIGPLETEENQRYDRKFSYPPSYA